MKILTSLAAFLLISIGCFAQTDTTTYKEEPIEFKIDSATLYGQYIKAANSKKIALIIAGSGPTNGDGNSPYFKSNTYKYIAEELARNGISSVRFDKRGVGKSLKAGKKESDLRFEMYIDDANQIVNAISKFNYKEIIIIGHSEGSLVGMLVASSNKNITKYISVSGAGSSADVLLKEQFKSQPDEVSTRAVLMIDSVKAGIPVPSIPPYLKSVFRKSIQGYMNSWFKYDPQVEIKKVKVPILIIQGTHDIQVQVIDGQNLYLANPKATLRIIDNMNHVLRIVESEDRTENLKSYNNPGLPLSSEFLKAVVEFCK